MGRSATISGISRLSEFPGIRGERKTGCKPHSEILQKRRRHIRVAYCRLILKRPTKWITRHFHISIRTMQLWQRAALSYNDPEAETLRQLYSGGPD